MHPKSGRRWFCGRLAMMAVSALACARADDPPQKDDKTGNKDGPKEEIYEPGGDVKPPKLVHYVEPAFSSKSREAFVEGTVRISTVVTTEGIATESRVVSGLNAEEDRTAVEALKQWKFQPGTKAGKPVNVRVTVEVEFHLL